MFPDIDAEHDFLAFHERAVLVRAALDHQLAAVVDHPRPAAAEAADASLFDFFLQLVEPAERAGDRICNRTGRSTATTGTHDLPEHRVVRMTAAVVANRTTDVFGHGIDARQQFLDRLRVQLGVLVERGVEVRHVRLMMLAVVNFHRARIDVRLEGVERVWKRWK